MKNLFRICILLGALGIVLVYSSSIYIEPEKVNVSEIKPQWNGKQVSVTGNVVQPYRTKGNLFFTLEDSSGQIKVASFDSKTRLNSSQRINLTGRVSLYRGSLEIMAGEIKK